jgi:hypothetical protein
VTGAGKPSHGKHDDHQRQHLYELLGQALLGVTGALHHHTRLHPLREPGQERQRAERAEEMVRLIEPEPEEGLMVECRGVWVGRA